MEKKCAEDTMVENRVETPVVNGEECVEDRATDPTEILWGVTA